MEFEIMRWDEREFDWFEIWYPAGANTVLALVWKYKGDDAIELRELHNGQLWLKTRDYAEIRNELLEDDYSQVKGRELSDELYNASVKG